MRALKAIIALLFVLAGISLGALNQQTISIDLFFVRYQAHLGLALLLCVLAGAVIGGALASISLLTDKAAVPKSAKTIPESGKSA
ncbi:lipopolysaccharide assembly protein LapA domain-containing protein [Arenimonas sp.]|jgi:uncharacterized integral membrane protein|uniref:lipopolysaccharide assembly protein LapA domain-containing protein n=1 Tax=Arenimonas sp. TaxID=1872635 RepID=UPI0037C0BEB6